MWFACGRCGCAYDSGTTHNFVNHTTVGRGGFEKVPNGQCLRVRLADGILVDSTGVVTGPVEFVPGIVHCLEF